MFCEYLCVYRIGCSSDILGEDDPIGWFELEEEWDEADVKLQQCRVAKVSISELWPSRTSPLLPSFCLFLFFFFGYLFICLGQVLVAACRIFELWHVGPSSLIRD